MLDTCERGEDQTGQSTPQLRSTNWKRTRAFYEYGLGFRVDWEHQFEPGFPVFAQVTRDSLSLFLTEHAGDCQPGGAAYLIVDDVDALFREITARGVPVRGAARGPSLGRPGDVRG